MKSNFPVFANGTQKEHAIFQSR